jgi:hypothetical protein
LSAIVERIVGLDVACFGSVDQTSWQRCAAACLANRFAPPTAANGYAQKATLPMAQEALAPGEVGPNRSSSSGKT